MIGAILGNRYEIIEKIGGGGMAEVYKARCKLLNRYVAVKVLRQELMEDKDFVDRFHAEARSAASLSHPNIVSIYDVGQEGDLHYIVMEFIDGITLKERIIRQGAINWKETLDIVLQICFALQHAHKNGIIHRDIKPHNILITKDDIVKVTDFGIARVVNASTITYGGNTIGSVHYFSPEQAKGGHTDERSDIYSLGIVMYEMLTGNIPYKGDSHVSVAMKHIQDNFVPPREVNKKIPIALESIILKCAEKKPNERYDSADELIGDLDTAYNNPDKDFVTRNISDDSPTQKIQPIRNVNGSDEDMVAKKKRKNKKEDKIAVIAAIITSIVLIGIISYFGYGFVKDYIGGTNVEEEEVPNIVGKDIERVKELYKDSQFSILEVSREYSDEYKENQIISQIPKAGTSVKLPHDIEVTVSKGIKMVKVPDLINRDYRQAEIELENLNLRYTVKYEFDDEIPNGYVIRQNPEADTQLSEESLVKLFVSNGPEPQKVTMPNLTGMMLNDAEEKIDKLNLVVGDIERIESEKKYNTVLEQSIAPGEEIEEKTLINLKVSNNKEGTTQRFIKINLPQNKEEVKVTLVYHTGGSKKVIYENIHKTQKKTLTIPVSGKGMGFIQVYIDDTLVGEDVIDFGGDGE